MSPALASKVRAEVKHRHISLRKLFEEMWELYRTVEGFYHLRGIQSSQDNLKRSASAKVKP
jgi:hypothetical protein